GRGLYSFKGSGYVRGGIFDRIELIQGVETVRFRDYQHHRMGDIVAEGAPHIQEIGVFILEEDTQFDPTQPWRIQLLVQRATGALDKIFLPFELDYNLPAEYTQVIAPPQAELSTNAPSAEAQPTQPESSAVQAPAFSMSALGGLEDTPLWVRI